MDCVKVVWDLLITKSTVTCVSHALDLYIDEPKSDPILKGSKGFVKTRVLISIDFLSTLDLKYPPLRGNGGDPGIYIVALIHHSITFTQKVSRFQNCTEFRRREGIELSLDDL